MVHAEPGAMLDAYLLALLRRFIALFIHLQWSFLMMSQEYMYCLRAV